MFNKLLMKTKEKQSLTIIAEIGSEYVVLKKDTFEEIKEEIESNNPGFLASLNDDFSGNKKNWRDIKNSK